MGRHSVFRFWESALPDDLCDLIVRVGRAGQKTVAGLQPDGASAYVDQSIRKTEIFFWTSDHWINGLTYHYAMLANEEVWNYRLSCSQGVQFGEYADGGTYDWHKDEFDMPFGDESPKIWRGLARKLSVVVNLSDPNDYEGGQLEFKDTFGEKVADTDLMQRIRSKGSVVVFPAYTPHRVTPVESGVRHSLATWVLGPPFA